MFNEFNPISRDLIIIIFLILFNYVNLWTIRIEKLLKICESLKIICLRVAIDNKAEITRNLSEINFCVIIVYYIIIILLYFVRNINYLDLLPTSKGLVAGELTFTLTDNRIIDCTVPGGVLIPHNISEVISVRTRAKMVLIVEKDAVFQKLLKDDCTSSLSCILVTGKGYPDVTTRMLVKLLSEKLELPVYIIVDADPFGVDIMCVYR